MALAFKALVVALSFLSAVLADGQLSDDEQASFARQLRESMGLEETVGEIEAGKIDPKRLAVIRAVLKNTNEVHIHQQRGAVGNAVYLHPEGHQEAVYGPDGNLVSDGINDGSYNYFHPRTDAVRHFVYDIHPWIRWGTSKQDPTTRQERIAAYMKDLEEGIVRAAEAGEFPAVDVSTLRDGEADTFAVFLRAVDAGNAEELYAAIEGRKILVDKSRRAVMDNVRAGFERTYAEAK